MSTVPTAESRAPAGRHAPAFINMSITSPDGRVFGKMAHAERRDNGVAVNIYGEQDLKIFESGVAYFK